MTRTLYVAAGVAALVVLPLILTYEVIGPMVIAGDTRPSGSTDAVRIGDYYRGNAGLAALTLVEFATVPLAALFVFGLGHSLWSNPRARPWLLVACAAFTAEIPLILAAGAIQGAIALTEGTSPALFRAWDLLWNSGVYILEAGLVAAFALAAHAAGRSRATVAFGAIVALALAFDALVLWLPIPPQSALPANLLFSAWFIVNGVGLLHGPPCGAR